MPQPGALTGQQIPSQGLHLRPRRHLTSATVEQAGFRDVTIQYIAWAGDGPADRLFAKDAGPFGGDMRLTRGIKP